MTDADRSITPAQKEAIRSYVFKVITPSGIVLLICSFVIGFMINEVARSAAYHEAFGKAQDFVLSSAREVAVASTQASSALKEIDASKSEIYRLTNDMSRLNREANELANKNSESVARIIMTNGQFKSEILRLGEPELENMKFKLSQFKSWSKKPATEIGYGAGIHKHTIKQVSCTSGNYVTGIKVRYGGTCLYQCDADGGIIQEITLLCRSLPDE